MLRVSGDDPYHLDATSVDQKAAPSCLHSL